MLGRPRAQVQFPHSYQDTTTWVQLEEAGTSRVLAAMYGVDEALALVLIDLDLLHFMEEETEAQLRLPSCTRSSTPSCKVHVSPLYHLLSFLAFHIKNRWMRGRGG